MTVKRPLLLTTGSLLLACAALTGCQPDKGPGTLTVAYVLGNSKTCEEVGVAQIDAELIRGSGDDRTVLYDARVTCGGEIVIDDIEAKTYELEVVGYDDDNVPVFDNLADPISERRVEIFEAADAMVDVDLTARPANLRLRWRLGNDGFADCDGVGIDRFEVKAFQEGGGALMLEQVLDCELDGEGSGNWRVIEDPDRDLIGVLFGEVGVQGLDASGNEVGDPATYVFDPVGPGYTVDMTIECTEMGCATEEP